MGYGGRLTRRGKSLEKINPFLCKFREKSCNFACMMDDIEKKLQEKLRFAGEKIPSMKRRSNINNYYGRHIYMVTMATEETLRRKAEAKHYSYRPIPVKS